MDTKHWQLIEAYFHRALELPAEQRNAFIAGEFAGQPDVRDAILRMLEHTENTSPLNAIVEQAAISVLDANSDLSGTMAGAYRLTQKIESGGMGAVYLAERADDQYQKQVAVKLIKTAASDQYLAKRFVEERQTLANLDHANITRLIDGGSTHDGIPFLVMEYVHGIPVDKYCEQHQLSLQQRLTLFIKICDALQYAHQKLVVHCDLKPSNIMVSDTGEPKLMDFGIARLLNKAASREDNHQLMTLNYASPEQLAGKPVSVASDIYSLGLILHKLVCGNLPAGYDGTDSATRLTSLKQAKPVNVCRRAHHPRGEVLDAIINKALQFAAADRFDSVSGLKSDIENYLTNYPVNAFGPGRWYKARLFVVRNTLSTLLVSALVILILSTSITIWLQSQEVAAQKVLAEQERDTAQLAQQKAETISDFITDMFTNVKPDKAKGELITVQDVINATIARLDDEDEAGLADQPLVNAEIRRTIGNMLWQTGDIAEAIIQLETAVSIYEQHPGEEAKTYLLTLNALSNAYSRADRHPERLPILQKVVEQSKIVNGENARNTLGYTLNLGGYYNDMQQPQQAIDIHLNVLERAREYLGEDDEVTMITLASLGNDYYRYGDDEKAKEYFNYALTDATKTFGQKHTLVIYTLERLVTIISDGQHDEHGEALAYRYLALSTDMLGERHQDTLRAHFLLARILYQKHDYNGALAKLNDTIPVITEVLGADHYRVTDFHSLKATVLMESGQLAAALPLSQQVLEAKTKRYGELDDYTIIEQHKVGDIYLRLGQLDEAEAAFAIALNKWQQYRLTNPADYKIRYQGEHEALLALAAVYQARQQPEKRDEVLANASEIESQYADYSYRKHDAYFLEE